ncbi:YhfZ family protein [Phytohabitans sp. ZYX-F-186]|uniref:YhfZ family protein n=1 Tax=Phytohabitans maris TaxID=3071409 RepID=A0ABU0ZH14_9ACTN|nr:YhfZ family protein [Phytohabitans sp. ZYX-F-186]MDQ7906341.1 YhfZ family protein [Phytohabitans sp. ZYX-F-186]
MSGGFTKPDVLAHVARVLLTREVGQRIPTVQELQTTSGAGTGTVVKALRSLETGGAVTLTARGHQGTVVADRDVGKLWNAAELGNFRLVMPASGPLEQQAILDVIQGALRDVGVSVVVDYRPGAHLRLEEVYHERAHATVTSAGALAQHRDSFPGLAGVHLGPSTFYSSGSLVVVEHATRPPKDPPRVGIDHSSYDHQKLSEAEFAGTPVEYVECPFVVAPAAVLAGEVDAAVWHSMPTVIPPELAGLRLRPVANPAALDVVREISPAVLVTRAIEPGPNALLRQVRPADVAGAQSRLLKMAATDGFIGSLRLR